MGKTRKSKPKFRHGVNRRRMNKRNKRTGHFSPFGSVIKHAWQEKATLRKNMKNMGLAYDPNEVLKIPKATETFKKVMSTNPDAWSVKKSQEEKENTEVVRELEKVAKAPQEKFFALPQNHVIFLTYLLDTYGENYKAMARDRKNYYQETWKQLRAKVQLFKKVPHQWAEYLKHREELEKSLEES